MFTYFCLLVKSLGIAGDQRLAFPAPLSQGSRRRGEKAKGRTARDLLPNRQGLASMGRGEAQVIRPQGVGMRCWKERPHRAGIGAILVTVVAGEILPLHGTKTAWAQTPLFPPLYRLQGGSPASVVEGQPLPAETPWRPVTPDQLKVESVVSSEEARSEGPVFDLELLRQFGSGGGGLGSGQGEGSGPGSGQSGGRGSSPGSGVGTGQGAGGGAGLEAGSRRQTPQVTGLLVDARGLDFLPSQSMRLLDPDGNPVYPPANLGQDLNVAFVGSEGTAAYATSEEQARLLVNRIGERPYRIRAMRTLGYDLVISAEDAFNLRQMNAVDGFLDRFAVVVIWDGSQASRP